MKRPNFKSSLSGILLLACGACSSGEDNIDTTTSWLGPLHRYVQLSGSDDFGVYLLKDDLGRPAFVDHVIVGPAEITVSVESDLNSISPAAYEQLRAAFTAALDEEITERPPGSGTTGDSRDTYVVRAALTNLTIRKISKEFGQVGLNDLEFRFDDAALEIGLYESTTNLRRAVIIEKVQANTARWNDLRSRFGAFAAQIAKKTAEARAGINGKAAQPEPPAPQKTPQPEKK